MHRLDVLEAACLADGFDEEVVEAVLEACAVQPPGQTFFWHEPLLLVRMVKWYVAGVPQEWIESYFESQEGHSCPLFLRAPVVGARGASDSRPG